MTDIETNLAAAGDALQALAEGPGAEAAAALEAAFGQAGARIEQVLAQVARSGELDFSRMAEAVLRDLARIAAEAVTTQSAASQALNVTMNFAQAAEDGGVATSRTAIATTLARLVSGGARFT